MVVATFEVPALRKTELGARWLGAGRRIPGLGSVSQICGSDPMAALTELALAIPAKGRDGTFGVYAIGSFRTEELSSCARQLIERRGGRPVISPAGSFRVIRDANGELSDPELAISSDGLVVLSEGPYVRASIDAAERRIPSVQHSRPHRKLRRAVGPGTVVATVVLTPEQRQTIVEELARRGVRDSPFASVNAAAASIRLLSRAVSVHVSMFCDRPEACREAGSIIEAARRNRARDWGIRIVGMAAVFDALRVVVKPDGLHLHFELPTGQASKLVEHFLTTWGFGRSPASAALTATRTARAASAGPSAVATADGTVSASGVKTSTTQAVASPPTGSGVATASKREKKGELPTVLEDR